jgi:hypothetical protein
MIQVIRKEQRHFNDFGWLKTYWLFSFADYFDPANIQFGALRVFNDDVVEPGTGFPTHPHKEMEIVTIVLDGEMTHEDSMGTKTVIRPGDVQRMSAGTGVTHSEFNLGTHPVHFYQIWILPDLPDLAPSYDQRTYRPSDYVNRLFPLASGQGIADTVTLHTDATIYRSDLEPGHSLAMPHVAGRRVFIYLAKGEIAINGTTLRENEQARIDEDASLHIEGRHHADFVLIDVPSC